jgi:nucleoside 2-deoxyribosyltransferase
MNCFIASAFDHDDVDAIYDLAIRPILKALKIRPTRADRVEHNDDIDDRIFTLIDQSQFCIADLTFARPSVYYEAGYAFGSAKPVIYIARHDHFRARNDDPPGNLRVHFDLQMKNIIPWFEANEAFKKRLRGRIRHVLKPILARKQITDAEREEEKRFASTSQHARLAALLERGRSLLQSQSYSPGKFPDKRPFGDNVYHLYFEKFSGKKLSADPHPCLSRRHQDRS